MILVVKAFINSKMLILLFIDILKLNL